MHSTSIRCEKRELNQSLLNVFRTPFVAGLLGNIKPNLDKYRSSEKWAMQLGSLATRELATRIELKSPLVLDEPDEDNLKDLENAIRIHKLLNQLTPLQARDPRLWTRLTHAECWNYMRERWPIERFADDTDKGVRFIASRYFIAQSDSRALMRNGIARLWWTAHMSYDPQRKNPYELTAVLLHRLDITQQLMERNMGRAPVIVSAFLEFLMQNRHALLVAGDQSRSRVRKLAKFLNMCGGVSIRLLDTDGYHETPWNGATTHFRRGVCGEEAGEEQMTDCFTPQQRSRNMSRIRSNGNSSTELRFIRILREYKIWGWRRRSKLPGRPDFVFTKRKVAVFIDGDFWHGNPRKFRIPKSNCTYWEEKILGNRTRDRRITKELKAMGWNVLRIWESSLKDEEAIIAKLKILL